MKIILLALLALTPLWAVTVYTSDFIPTLQRTHFNGFEGTSGITQITDLIKVVGVNVDDSISSWLVAEGSNSWYHNGGDYGYTAITMSDNSDFVNIGMYVYNGWSDMTSVYYNYQVRNNGVVIASGSVLVSSMPSIGIGNFRYLGFAAESTPFDQIYLSATNGSAQSPVNGSYQALCIDGVETSGTPTVPEPATFVLFGLALVNMIWIRRN